MAYRDRFQYHIRARTLSDFLEIGSQQNELITIRN